MIAEKRALLYQNIFIKFSEFSKSMEMEVSRNPGKPGLGIKAPR